MFKYLAAFVAAMACGTAYAAPVRFDTGPGATGSYYEIGTRATTWTTANAIANSLSHSGLAGHLVNFESAEEEAFVANLLLAAAGSIIGQANQSVAWIGLNDAAVEGDYRWSGGPEAGTSATYTNWIPGEPNNINGNEDFVHMTVNYAYGWNDLPDYFVLAYVVEYSDPEWSRPVPLPASFAFLLGGLGALGLSRRRKRTS